MKIHVVMKLWDNSKVDLTKKGMNSKFKPPEVMRAYIRRASADKYLASLRAERAKKRPSRDYKFEIDTLHVHDYKPPEDFYAKRNRYHGDTDYSFSEAEGL